ncbi:hypothetical protein EMIHUDRAFT_195378 [Emiliania huxleyi CCMP1516]|uniref:Uncharacterized protein n=2 Tax=Emiliania huxleyi TaxID=2903 RepID=A0A0D3JHE6_EMIH1|nr:hypothetical protein EMIHUDRAFT_195378 [Emiliania huxleyi CCMP1516]EOD22931.1 hypothetical protein EMIHUDRAFT_195378 [Emiliania huxleyi CCMP1516]|eukprot:XP_005775360.1 hypothetical protein EMIHUDRAFT_195378 [Emiliania huxleyi CCMP1516]
MVWRAMSPWRPHLTENEPAADATPECVGRWLSEPSDFAGADASITHSDLASLAFPQPWPAVWRSRSLQRLLNQSLGGRRCRAVQPPSNSERAALAAAGFVAPAALHSFSNAERVCAATGYQAAARVIPPAGVAAAGQKIEGAAAPCDGPSLLALRHWWNDAAGTWLDFTPLVPGEQAWGGTRLLVEAASGDKPLRPLGTAGRAFACAIAARLSECSDPAAVAPSAAAVAPSAAAVAPSVPPSVASAASTAAAAAAAAPPPDSAASLMRPGFEGRTVEFLNDKAGVAAAPGMAGAAALRLASHAADCSIGAAFGANMRELAMEPAAIAVLGEALGLKHLPAATHVGEAAAAVAGGAASAEGRVWPEGLAGAARRAAEGSIAAATAVACVRQARAALVSPPSRLHTLASHPRALAPSASAPPASTRRSACVAALALIVTAAWSGVAICATLPVAPPPALATELPAVLAGGGGEGASSSRVQELLDEAARDAARRAALKRDPLCPIVRKAAQQWTEEDENPPRATMAHVLSGACLGNREQARWFLRVARAQTGTAISKVAQAAPDSKDTLKTLRMAHVAALKGSRYRVLDEDGYDTLAPAVGGVLPALVDDLSEKSRRDLGTGVTRNLQVVAEAATGAGVAEEEG